MSMLTVKRIEAERPDPSKDRRIADGLGLYLKVAKNGTKSFTYRFTYGRDRKELSLGIYPAMSLADARKARQDAAETLEGGKNPLQEKQSERQAKRDALDVNALIAEFRTNFLNVHFEQPAAAHQCLTRDVGKEIGRMLVPDVTKKDIARVITKIVLRGSKVAANRTLTLTRQLFDYAVSQALIEESPVTLTRKGAGGKEKSVTRNLSLNQITDLMKTLARDDLGVTEEVRDSLTLILATAKRPSEAVTVEWKHLDLDKAIWVNPKELTKEKRDDHTVFLSPFAVQLLKRVKERSGDARHVFPSPHDSKRHIDRHSLSRAVLRLVEDGTLKVKFTPHDLRRTFSSRMADLGQMPHVVEKILDHQMEGVMAVYNRASYLPERQAAMNLWGQKLEELSKQ